jgi:hypothetical protein
MAGGGAALLLCLPESVLRDHLMPCLPCKAALALGSCCNALVEVCRMALADLGVVNADQIPPRLASHPSARSLVFRLSGLGVGHLYGAMMGLPGQEGEQQAQRARYEEAAEALAGASELRHIEVQDQGGANAVLRALELGGLPAFGSLECSAGWNSEQPFLNAMSKASTPVKIRLMRSLRRLAIAWAHVGAENFQSLCLLSSLTHLTFTVGRTGADGREWEHLPCVLSPALEHLHIEIPENQDMSSLLLWLGRVQDASKFKLRSLRIVSPGVTYELSGPARDALVHVIAENAPFLTDCALEFPDMGGPTGGVWPALAECPRLRALDVSHDMIRHRRAHPYPPALSALERLRVAFSFYANGEEGLWPAMQGGVFPRLTHLELVGISSNETGEGVTRAFATIAPTLKSLRFGRLSVRHSMEARLGEALATLGSLSSLSLHFAYPRDALQCLYEVAAGIDFAPTATAMPLRVLEVGDLTPNDLVAFMDEPPPGLVRPTVEVLRLGVDRNEGERKLLHGRLEPFRPLSLAAREGTGVAGADDPSDEVEDEDEDEDEAQARLLEGGKARVEDVIMTWLTSPQIKDIKSVVFHDLYHRPSSSLADRVLRGVSKLDGLHRR